MTSWVLLLAASSVGIEAGWKPLATGGHEYTVQIEPELVRLLETGNDLVSEVPAEIHVRSLRITVGKGGVARLRRRYADGRCSCHTAQCHGVDTARRPAEIWRRHGAAAAADRSRAGCRDPCAGR